MRFVVTVKNKNTNNEGFMGRIRPGSRFFYRKMHIKMYQKMVEIRGNHLIFGRFSVWSRWGGFLSSKVPNFEAVWSKYDAQINQMLMAQFACESHDKCVFGVFPFVIMLVII